MERIGSFLKRRWLGVLLAAAVLAWGGWHAWAWSHWFAAQRHLREFRAAAARGHLEACLDFWPEDPDVHLLAARAARLVDDYEAAQQHLRTCERLGWGPSHPELLLEWSLVRAAAGVFAESVEGHLFTRLESETDPAQAEMILEALARGYIRAFRIREATICLDRWDQIRPETPQALQLRGDIWRQVRKLQKAVPEYQKALDKDPERDEARKWLAVGLAEAGRYAEALVHLDHLLARGERDPTVRVHQARCYKGLGRLDEARAVLDKVLAESPDLGVALRARGEVEMGEAPERAEVWLRKAVAASPHDYTTQFFLLQALLQQGKDAEAKSQRLVVDDLKERVERLGDLTSTKLSVRPNDPALQTEMGSLLMGLGKADAAKYWLLSAVQNAPAHAPAHRLLAELFEREGSAEQAAFHRQLANR